MKSLYHQFGDWVRSQPEDLTYDYFDSQGCAMATFLHEVGIQFDEVRGTYWRSKGKFNHFPDALLAAPGRPGVILAIPHTYGALAERLSHVGY